MKVVPAQKPGSSVQNVETPQEFIDAVEKAFGKIHWDLAATASNTKASHWLGPGSVTHKDLSSLDVDWSSLQPDGNTVRGRAKQTNLWLNPPYADIEPWARKCAQTSMKNTRIFLLTPAVVGTNYFKNYIFEVATVFFLSPRIKFVGHTQGYPKDMILSVYGATSGFECWRWDE